MHACNIVFIVADLSLAVDDKIRVKVKPVQQQHNSFDCGVFSVAFMVDVLHDGKPIGQGYDVDQMRQHLLSCVENGKFSPFPKVKKVKE